MSSELEQYPQAARQHAAAYWRQYEVTVDYVRPWKLKGVVDALREVKNAQDEWVPRVAILGEKIGPGEEFSGALRLLVVTAHPSRLRAELILAAPAVGDRIWIEYLGEDPKAAKGLNKTKRFTVVVKAPHPPPAPPAGTSGKLAQADETPAGEPA